MYLGQSGLYQWCIIPRKARSGCFCKSDTHSDLCHVWPLTSLHWHSRCTNIQKDTKFQTKTKLYICQQKVKLGILKVEIYSYRKSWATFQWSWIQDCKILDKYMQRLVKKNNLMVHDFQVPRWFNFSIGNLMVHDPQVARYSLVLQHSSFIQVDRI